MINQIIYAISRALHGEFGNRYEIHMEEIRQGLVEPCFFVSCLNPTTSLFLGRRYFRRNQFCIQYFPHGPDLQRECSDVAERMTWCLEYIKANGDFVRGTKISHEVVGGILNFLVNYDMFVYRVERTEPMEKYMFKTEMKGRD